MAPTEADIIDAIRALTASMNTQFDKLEESINDRFEQVAIGMNSLAAENNKLREQLSDVERRLDRLESTHRRKNVILNGLTGINNEAKTDTEKLVRNFVRERLKSKTIDVDTAQRLNSKRVVKPIKICFSRMSDRNEFFDKVRELGDKDIMVKPDLPNEVRETRRKLSRFYSDAKSKNQKVKVRYDRIIIDGVTYNYDASSDSLVKMDHSAPGIE